MPNILVRYHRYLVSETESISSASRVLALRGNATPWLTPIVVAGGVVFVMNVQDPFRTILLASGGVISLLGLLYVGFVMLVYGVSHDFQRLRDARPEDR